MLLAHGLTALFGVVQDIVVGVQVPLGLSLGLQPPPHAGLLQVLQLGQVVVFAL